MSGVNPYAPPLTDQLPAAMSSGKWLLCEGDQVNTGGWGWPWCRERICSEFLELSFLTRTIKLPIAKIQLLRSEGRGADRTLQIVHGDDVAPDTIKVYPHYPARWFDVFESLGIPTEDEADLRSSSQSTLRSSSWVSFIEGSFWFAVLAASLVLAGVSWVMGFFR